MPQWYDVATDKYLYLFIMFITFLFAINLIIVNVITYTKLIDVF